MAASRGNAEYLTFAHRAIMAAGRRIGDGDVAQLATLKALSHSVTYAVDEAITGLIADGYNAADIARHLGITRQAVHQRHGEAIRKGTARLAAAELAAAELVTS